MSPPDARSPALVTPAAQDIEAEQQGLSNTETGAAPQALATALRPIGGITVGQRFRRDLGDIDGLAKSLAEIGLLQPVVVRPDESSSPANAGCAPRSCSAGPRFPSPSSTSTPSCAASSPRTPSARISRSRKPSPLSGRWSRWRRRGPKSGCSHGKPSGKFPKGRALDNVARVVGKDRRTIEKAAAVVDAAEAEPEKFGPLLAAMDKTGRVNAPYERLQVAKQAEKIRAEPPPLPGNGPYSVAVADIAWAAEPEGDADRAARRGYWPYPTLTIEQACALPVDKIMADDAILWMWVTNFILVRGLHLPVLTAWGFEPKNIITWPKEKAGTGIWLRGQSEHVVMAVRGKPIVRSQINRPCCLRRRADIRRSPPSSTTLSRHSARRRATPICSRATGTTTCRMPR